MELGAVDRVLAEHRTDDHLLAGDDQLAVVAGDVAFLVAHHPHVRVGDVRPRLGVVAVGPRLLRRPPAPRFVRRGSRFPRLDLGPLRVPASLVLGGEPIVGPGQPLAPLGPPGQRPRHRRFGGVAERASSAASVSAASARIFSICGSVWLAACAALPASFVPSRLSMPNDTIPSAASSRSTWLNSPPSAFS